LPHVFLTSNLSGQQITKKNPAIFPKRLSALCFSLRLHWKNIEAPRCYCKNCGDFFSPFTDRSCRIQTVSNAGLTKLECLSRVIISAVVSFVSMDIMTNPLFVITPNEMSSLYSSARFCT